MLEKNRPNILPSRTPDKMGLMNGCKSLILVWLLNYDLRCAKHKPRKALKRWEQNFEAKTV